MKTTLIALMTTFVLMFASTSKLQAQDTEERFHDLFVTAGYSTAFGAALGAAVLGLTNEPASNIRFIFAGASLGFIGGSVLGSYVIFSPMLISDNDKATEQVVQSSRPGWSINPHYNTSSGSITGANFGFNFSVN